MTEAQKRISQTGRSRPESVDAERERVLAQPTRSAQTLLGAGGASLLICLAVPEPLVDAFALCAAEGLIVPALIWLRELRARADRV
jgi:hypothetical protein